MVETTIGFHSVVGYFEHNFETHTKLQVRSRLEYSHKLKKMINKELFNIHVPLKRNACSLPCSLIALIALEIAQHIYKGKKMNTLANHISINHGPMEKPKLKK